MHFHGTCKDLPRNIGACMSCSHLQFCRLHTDTLLLLCVIVLPGRMRATCLSLSALSARHARRRCASTDSLQLSTPLTTRSTAHRQTEMHASQASVPDLQPQPKAAPHDDGSSSATAAAGADAARGNSGTADSAPTAHSNAAVTLSQQKQHSSALCLIPDRGVWAQLQSVRCSKDKVRTCTVANPRDWPPS